MTLNQLDQLLAQAMAARDNVGRSAAAERLHLFRPVVDALQAFVEREREQSDALRALQPQARLLLQALIAMELSPRKSGPSAEQVTAYYDAAQTLRLTVQALKRATRPVVLKNPLSLEK